MRPAPVRAAVGLAQAREGRRRRLQRPGDRERGRRSRERALDEDRPAERNRDARRGPGREPLLPLHRHQCRPRREGQGLLPSHLDGGGGERRLDPGHRGRDPVPRRGHRHLELGRVALPLREPSGVQLQREAREVLSHRRPPAALPTCRQADPGEPRGGHRGVGQRRVGRGNLVERPMSARGQHRTAPAPRCRPRRTRGTGT